jgi:hypothetical protein
MKEIITNKYKIAQSNMGSSYEGYPEGVTDFDINRSIGEEFQDEIVIRDFSKNPIEVDVNWEDFYNWTRDKNEIEQYNSFYSGKIITVFVYLKYKYNKTKNTIEWKKIFKVLGDGDIDITNTPIDEYLDNEIDSEIIGIEQIS